MKSIGFQSGKEQTGFKVKTIKSSMTGFHIFQNATEVPLEAKHLIKKMENNDDVVFPKMFH